ncbi:MAG TPA: uracil-DNA glycosylase [Rhodospirillaceae bacterium]|nr:MAG: uracil-DNA glycosylase [Alphaproteobacteria bacterium GWF2_58_20]HAU28852.1 uracil-DNA glycosylase [Rhodospirillaceae bacterium]
MKAPGHDCPLCPRLAAFREENRKAYPDFFNGPVPSFGDPKGQLVIVGLAPGLKGANQTGRPFTRDFAGDLLFSTLITFGFAKGTYLKRADDGLTLINCRLTNAVRCVPPQNKPETSEITTCRPFLIGELSAATNAKVIIALGGISHGSVLRACGMKPSQHAFAHGAEHDLGDGRVLIDCYHCSRLNTNTGRLTETMFHDVFRRAQEIVSG